MLLETKVIGNLGADCLVKKVNGKTAINFSVAYNERYVDADGVVNENTTWINAAIFQKQETALIKYLKKGQLVYLSGTPKVNLYRDKQGEPKIDFSLLVRDIKLLGGKTENSTETKTETEKQKGNGVDFSGAAPVKTKPTPAAYAGETTPDDDLPF